MLIPRNQGPRRYGWRRDLPDRRDYRHVAARAQQLPPVVDLRPSCPPVYDQGNLGSCTANAIGGAIEFDLLRQGSTVYTPSRLFIYYGERVIENDVRQDGGAQIRDGLKVVAKLGAPPESLWPYVVKLFARKPPPAAYAAGLKDRARVYSRVEQTEAGICECLAEKFPVVFGFTCYESLESPTVARTGYLPMPSPHEQSIGGHAVLIVGYDATKRLFLVRNSWGIHWGLAGYFWMPFGYVLDPGLADDFWTIRTMGA